MYDHSDIKIGDTMVSCFNNTTVLIVDVYRHPFDNELAYKFIVLYADGALDRDYFFGGGVVHQSSLLPGYFEKLCEEP